MVIVWWRRYTVGGTRGWCRGYRVRSEFGGRMNCSMMNSEKDGGICNERWYDSTGRKKKWNYRKENTIGSAGRRYPFEISWDKWRSESLSRYII
jgi:hypothetical protein